MLRAVSAISLESPVFEMFASAAARRDFCKIIREFRIQKYSSSAPAAATQTVLTSERVSSRADGAPPPASLPPAPPPPPRPPRRSWTAAAAALAVTASLGGVFFYRKMNDVEKKKTSSEEAVAEEKGRGEEEEEAPYPAAGDSLPRHVQFLLVGGGTASFAAMRAIRAARPDAAVLLVGEEPLPPYMRPPLSKELWREPPAAPHASPDQLSFRQWNGKRRPLLYEPLAFYTPVERLAAGEAGAGAARGWRVVRLDVLRHEAELRAPGRDPVTLSYDKCLVATGVKPRRLEVLRPAREAGLAVAVRGVRDAARLARLVDAPGTKHVVLVGGGFLATELSAALAERLSAQGTLVTQVFREAAPLERVVPAYLAREAARRLRAAGVRLEAGVRVAGAAVQGAAVELRLADGRTLRADAVVECVGSEGDAELARASGLELADGALAVTAELQARADVWAAGDAVSWHDVALGRRRLEHHDHAVASGRRAGENMAGVAPQRPYDHQPMFWSDLGPELGYEAIGIIDSRLPTVGVFSAADVKEAGATVEATPSGDDAAPERERSGAEVEEGDARRYERGVVFYKRDNRVVGILLWNLFNRMHVARQVLAHGEFDDLFEVAKLFSLHEEE